MCIECHGAARFDQHDVYDRTTTTPEVLPMQSYTFASNEAMAAVLAAFDASGDDTYDITMWRDTNDMRALATALRHAVTTTTDVLDLQATVDVLRHIERDGDDSRCTLSLGRPHFRALLFALRSLWEAAPEGDADGSVYDNAGSLLSGIAETLGIEFI